MNPKLLRAHNSRMLRGAKWNSFNTLDGLPLDITADEGKMMDVRYYLKFRNAPKEEVENFVSGTEGLINSKITEMMDALVVNEIKEVKPEDEPWKKKKK